MKGQFILEFLVLITLAVILGVTYLAVTNELFFSTSEQQRVLALDDVGFRIQNEVIIATKVENGYQRNITIPTQADRFQYTIVNDATTITLTSGTLVKVYDIPQISGSFQKGANIIAKNGGIQVMPG